MDYVNIFFPVLSSWFVLRLTADVQDFKSSFKMVISQGLRGITQTVGCFVSLYIISPQMTGLMGVTLPIMIGVGSVIGTILRQWSRQAQGQVSYLRGEITAVLSCCITY